MVLLERTFVTFSLSDYSDITGAEAGKHARESLLDSHISLIEGNRPTYGDSISDNTYSNFAMKEALTADRESSGNGPFEDDTLLSTLLSTSSISSRTLILGTLKLVPVYVPSEAHESAYPPARLHEKNINRYSNIKPSIVPIREKP